MSISFLPSYRRQQLLLQYAAIKSKCPEGIYLSPTPTNPAQWAGVLFVRKPPYSSAVLRFELAFPPTYPDQGPTISFVTDIFHPLLVPLTTYTFATGTVDPNATVSSSEAKRLPPGAFNLHHEFPQWYQAEKGSRSARSSNAGAGSPTTAVSDHGLEEGEQLEKELGRGTQDRLLAVLNYVKRSFEDASFLDALPLSAAVNTNAWHAWRAHRGLPKLGSRSISPTTASAGRAPLSPGRNPGDWNWDGVWESRVRDGIGESTSDVTLFGSKNARPNASVSGPIRFTKNDDERCQEIQDAMLHALGLART